MEATAAERYTSGGPGAVPDVTSFPAAFLRTAARLGGGDAVIDGDRRLSWNELRAGARAVAGGLAGLGVGKGDSVALMLSNRLEFFPVDLGAVILGAVPFSIYQTASPEQIAYVVGDAGARVAVVEKGFLETFEKAREDLPAIEQVIVLDGEGGTMSYEDMLAADPGFDDEAAAATVGLDDLLTLIYTSGTTGPPKGVELTHRNLLGLVAGVDDLISFPEEGGKIISWLPAAHIAERGAHYYLPMTKGATVSVCDDPRRIIEFLPTVRPTWFFAVPRVWEKLKAGLETMLAGLPDEQREPAQKGLEAAIAKVRLEQAGEPVPDELAAAAEAMEEKMFAGLRAHLGLDEVLAVNVGAAPTPVEVLEFFHAIGIPVAELWGMSETCGAATVNPPAKVKLGTVGPPLPGVEIRLADDGEVEVRGDLIMAGYRNLAEKTAETIDEEGWLVTGDIGEIDEDGYLRIVDRKKELIINAAGKNMSPASIESHLKAASPLIGQAVAIGDRRPYNVALIVLDPEYAPAWAAKQEIGASDVAALAEDERVIAAVDEAVQAANAKMSRVEQIKKFRLLPEEWLPGGDELTPTMKLKRRPIADKYEAEIEALYAR
ncbi:MAG: long-chain fatty acid--CoA ligase [Thermoleophilia bacterium]|nr:long-chain fatty acid--CoA ligase [Thermoleophilia bacterium]GIK78025.1 MAG: fatty-acid--CoA ligase [Actinomycetes bacterium]